MGSNPKPNQKPDGLVSFTSTPATQRGKRRATHFLHRVGDIDCNIGTCPNSHEEHRQEFKEQTGKKILAHKCLFLNTERSYKRQRHATLKHFVGFFVQWWKAEITVAQHRGRGEIAFFLRQNNRVIYVE